MSDDIKLEPEAREQNTEAAGAEPRREAPAESAPASSEAPRERRRPGGDYGRDSRDSRDDSRSGPPRGRGRDGRPRFRSYYRRKVCKFCTRKTTISYRDIDSLRRFITDRGKILPRRITGTCPKHQRALSKAIKQARVLALL
ncbi:MAG: 30S ribosomal protein S18, partial [Spirochaetales bacterium]|nr:30S ribosomal protein S18 [Spirochaetales bacterium]